jgi:hypothetical protein
MKFRQQAYLASTMTIAEFTSASAAMLTPVVAVLGLTIAYRQWRTAQNKLKFDLFERRVAIYEAAQTYVRHIAREGSTTALMNEDFAAHIRGAKWLLNDTLDRHLRHLPKRGQDLNWLREDLLRAHTDDGRQRAELYVAVCMAEFEREPAALDEQFAPFLQLGH